MNAQVAISCAYELLQGVEAERDVDGESADDAEARSFVDQAVERASGFFRRLSTSRRQIGAVFLL